MFSRRRPRPADWAALKLLILPCVTSLLAERAWPQSGAVSVPVAVGQVVEREILASQNFVGTVMPLRTSTIGSAVEERVVEFPVNEGDLVEEGETLAVLRTDTALIELAGAEAELEVRRQELAELENGTRREEIDQGRARLTAAGALRELTRVRRQRAINLRQSGSITPQELDEALAEAEQAEQAYQEATAALNLLVAGPRVEQIARARAQMLVQQEVVNRLKDLLDKHTIRAPFRGHVVAEHTEVGQWVPKGQPIVDLVQLDSVEITVPVLEDYVRFLEPSKTTARVTLGALPGRSFEGIVSRVVPQADARSRSFPVKVEVRNEHIGEEVLIKAGMFARVLLPISERRKSLAVSKDAVVLSGSESIRYPAVFVVDQIPGVPGGTARAVTVELGEAIDEMLEVTGSLEVGQLVVLQGNERLRTGQPVTFVGDAPAPSAELTTNRP